MNENLNYWHTAIFAISILILMESANHVTPNNYYSSYAMKSSAGAGALSILLLVVSFIFGYNNNRCKDEADQYDNAIESLYCSDDENSLEHIGINNVKSIEIGARHCEILRHKQNKNHIANIISMIASLFCMTIACILFLIGVCLK